MSFDITWQNINGVNVSMSGNIDAREIGHANNRLYADERFERLKYKLFDLTEAEVILTKENLIELAALDFASTRWNNSMFSAIVTRNEEVRRLIELYYLKHMENSGWTIRVFSDLQEANDWIKSV